MFVRKKRGSAARRKPKGKARAKAGSRFPRPHLPEGLQQRHLDLIGLFLIAAGVYLVFVLFFGWDGGKVGYGLETGLEYLFGGVGARIATVLMLAVGAMLVTGTSISTVFRGIGRGARHTFAGGRGIAQTAIQHREDRRAERTSSAFETQAGPTDVMSTYPEDDEFEPTVAIAADPEEDPEPAEPEPATHEFAELAEEAEQGIEAEVLPEGEPVALTPMGNKRGVTESEQIDYRPPPAKVLEKGKGDKGPDPRDQETIGRKLIETLGHFGVEAKVVGIVSGPHVSRFELRLAPGTKVKKVTELSNDLAYALASTDIRILAPIPGKQAVGVEVPNTRRRLVRLGDIYAGRPEKTSPLVAWLGKGIDGNAVWTDLAKMPHVLVAGTTGSGKSGCVNAILSSILMHASPNDVRLVLVDPKQVELNHYEHVPHLLTPVVTSPRLAANVLANLIGEMESRYGIMGEARCRNLAELNRARAKAGEAPLPHILCVIDELADLMMVAPAEVEDSIIRLAQKSRATGIHLVLATQRPSTDIITGTIKVNIPARIAFAVSSQTDSRVILDQGGAEALLGQGDMLFRGAGTSKLARVQGAFVTEEEIARITGHWAKQGEPEFEAELLEVHEEKGVEAEGDYDPDADDLLDEAIRTVVQTETASVSMIQRRLRVGYTRAGRLIDMLERRGVISGYEGSKPRQVLITEADLPRVLSGGADPAPVGVDADEAGEHPALAPARRSRHNAGVDTGIGATLREARNRRKVELSEVEAAIKIRVRYLRAIEDEDWDVLPGVAYTRGFIRTYGYYLGLDGERLADEYRHGGAAGGGDRVPTRVEPVSRTVRSRERWTSGRLVVAAVCLGLVALVAGIALAGGGGGGDSSTPPAAGESQGQAEQRQAGQNAPVPKPGVTVRLVATAEVWTCLLGTDRKPLVDGDILAAGSAAGPFHGEEFELALGNGSVEVFVDDTRAEIAESSSPVGYRIDLEGKLTALEEGERPDCE